VSNDIVAILSMSLLLLSYKAFSPQVKTGRYRATGVIIPARIHHVELAAETVPLCGEKEAP
jgi:hypothetical protein